MEVTIGRMGRAHGLRGEVAVEIRTDDPDTRFAPGSVLATDPAGRGPLTVTATRPHRGRLLVTFAEVADRTAAEALAGTLLVLDVTTLPPPNDPEEFYDHQLIGLAAVTVDGHALGAVADVLHLPGGDVLAVYRPATPELLVPFRAAIVPEVDLLKGRVVIDPPPGLLELAERPAGPEAAG